MRIRPPGRRKWSLVAATVAAVGVAGCAGHGRTVIDTRDVGSLGSILTTSSGMTLYMFPPDAERQVTCVNACALDWPPLTVPRGGDPSAGPGVDQHLIGTVANPAGGPRVITYDGWPLYTYRDDPSPGVASGQGVYLNGGYWYVMSPSGQPLTVTL